MCRGHAYLVDCNTFARSTDIVKATAVSEAVAEAVAKEVEIRR